MASSSDKARPANRTAWCIILAALLLAILFGTILERAAATVDRAPVAEAQARPEPVLRESDRPVGQQAPVRSYHAEETSQQAGVLGFWILFLLWAGLLSAGVAPRVLQAARRIRHHGIGRRKLTVR